MRLQAEPIAAIILAVTGLAIALLAWSWMNASLGPVATRASLTQILALERGREHATVIAAGADPATGERVYTVELMHYVVTARRWFAFTIVAFGPGGAEIDPEATKSIQEALAEGSVHIYLLLPKSGTYVRNETLVEKQTVQPDRIILYTDTPLIYIVNTTVVLVRVPEYIVGAGDPTPQAIIEIRIPQSLVEGKTLGIITFTAFNDKWYEVTRITLPS